jgi:hypothetical protein
VVQRRQLSLVRFDLIASRIEMRSRSFEEKGMDALASPTTTQSRTLTTPEERARRTAAIDYARGSMRLEGFVLNKDVEVLNRRYIDGAITSAEHSAAIRRKSNL